MAECGWVTGVVGSQLGYLSSRGPKVAVAVPVHGRRMHAWGLAGITPAVGCPATRCPGSRTALAGAGPSKAAAIGGLTWRDAGGCVT